MSDWSTAETRVKDQAKMVREQHNLAWNAAGGSNTRRYIEDLKGLEREALKLVELAETLAEETREEIREQEQVETEDAQRRESGG